MNPDESVMSGLPAEEIRQHFSLAAARAGHSRPGEPIDQTQIDFATEIVTICARLLDRYPHPECRYDTLGDLVRGQLFEL